jgi:hypothetical protein
VIARLANKAHAVRDGIILRLALGALYLLSITGGLPASAVFYTMRTILNWLGNQSCKSRLCFLEAE